ncbi:MAG: PhzF family phenazine biosynthesis protein, partial [Dehalococcoidia bacterium]
DYRVRIFTPGGELPFAGHPTLGTCHAWIEAGGTPRSTAEVVQECGAGLVRIHREAERAAFAAPPLRTEPVADALLADVLRAIGVPRVAVRAAIWLDNGPRWLGLLLDSAARVLAIEPDHQALRQLAKVGVAGAYAPGEPCQFEVRAFAAATGIPEDPVTGSLNASLAQWLIPAGHAPERYVVAQGARVGRGGRVHIDRERGTVWVGGRSVTAVRGAVSL